MTHKLLLVDDSGLARKRMRAILEGAGFAVIEAADGMAALEQYFVERPDVVMLDLVMKGMYGLDVLTKLRELDPHARVIVVSADVQDSSQQIAIAGGAIAFLQKPIEPERILSAVRTVLEGAV